ncbi:MAG: hypothetical protein V7606_250 [Burkholderiales bacterium]
MCTGAGRTSSFFCSTGAGTTGAAGATARVAGLWRGGVAFGAAGVLDMAFGAGAAFTAAIVFDAAFGDDFGAGAAFATGAGLGAGVGAGATGGGFGTATALTGATGSGSVVAGAGATGVGAATASTTGAGSGAASVTCGAGSCGGVATGWMLSGAFCVMAIRPLSSRVWSAPGFTPEAVRSCSSSRTGFTPSTSSKAVRIRDASPMARVFISANPSCVFEGISLSSIAHPIRRSYAYAGPAKAANGGMVI